MNQDRQDLIAGRVRASFLPRAHRALDDRVYDLEVRGVECQHDVRLAAGRPDIRRETHVVLHVARANELVRVVVSFELGEEVLWRLAEHVDQHVDATTVRHADDDLLQPGGPAFLDQIIEHGDQALAALERKALLPDVFGVQITLDALRGAQPLQDRAPLVVRQRIVQHPVLEALANPHALPTPRQVREVGTHVAAVDALERRDDIREAHLAVPGAREPTGVELRLHVGLGQSQVLEPEHRRDAALRELERVEMRDLVAPESVYLDQARHGGLFLAGDRPADGLRRRQARGRRAFGQPLAHRAMRGRRDRLFGREMFEECPPVIGHRRRIGNELVVQFLDVRCVAAEQR